MGQFGALLPSWNSWRLAPARRSCKNFEPGYDWRRTRTLGTGGSKTRTGSLRRVAGADVTISSMSREFPSRVVSRRSESAVSFHKFINYQAGTTGRGLALSTVNSAKTVSLTIKRYIWDSS